MSTLGSVRIRHRKVSLKNTLKVVFEKNLENLPDVDPRDSVQVETGVEKAEEKELHLQLILNQNPALQKKKYIPTPNASTHWDDYKKYYHADAHESKSYIRQSATVEDCSGCPYNMDELDEEFLEKMNKDISEETSKCSEDEFEMIVYLFELLITEKQPFLSTDPSQLLPYSELEALVLEHVASSEKDPASLEKLLSQITLSVFTHKYKPSPYRTVAASVRLFGPKIYAHWRARKVEHNGGSLFPVLKFETNAATDDNDPYVCFRHREIRQTRKTRRTDQQSHERLRRLQAEMRQAKSLFRMVAKREPLRLQAIQADADVFDQQCKVKTLKRKVGVSGDDEDLLVTSRRRREDRRLPTRRETSTAAEKAEKHDKPERSERAERMDKKSSGSVKIPSSKIPDLDLVTLEQMLLEKDDAAQAAVQAKLRAREAADKGWVNLTDDPYTMWFNFFNPSEKRLLADSHLPEQENSETQAVYSLLNSLYPRNTTERLTLPLSHSMGRSFAKDHNLTDPQVMWVGYDAKAGGFEVRKGITDQDIAPLDSVSIPRLTSVVERKRVGRGGLMYVDRRGLIRKKRDWEDPENIEDERRRDRFRFDTEIEGDEVEDAYNGPARLNGVSQQTQQIRFGSMLLSKSYEALHEAQQQRQLRLKNRRDAQAQAQAQAAQLQRRNSPASTVNSGQPANAQLHRTPSEQASSNGSTPQPSNQNQAARNQNNQSASPTNRQLYPISVMSF